MFRDFLQGFFVLLLLHLFLSGCCSSSVLLLIPLFRLTSQRRLDTIRHLHFKKYITLGFLLRLRSTLIGIGIQYHFDRLHPRHARRRKGPYPRKIEYLPINPIEVRTPECHGIHALRVPFDFRSLLALFHRFGIFGNLLSQHGQRSLAGLGGVKSIHGCTHGKGEVGWTIFLGRIGQKVREALIHLFYEFQCRICQGSLDHAHVDRFIELGTHEDIARR
mmetsp:Transcript_11259/g.20611  ORF Transcript_11259/g.20611 Transcript_11259/m.20611 type:complete len:219 (+) Transcript_11259:411-1067(+)